MAELANKFEAQLKAAVIDRLFARSYVDDDAVLVSEMTVANWSRRVDVVLANGKLWGFEIKSDADSLSRLPGQIETFRHHFEKFVVVAAERFEAAILDMVPEGVGVWIADHDGGLKQKIAPRQSLLSGNSYISLMTVCELRNLLAANGRKNINGAPRSILQRMAAGLPISDLASAAREAIKRRHVDRYKDFLVQREADGTLAAIVSLRRLSNHAFKGHAIQEQCSTELHDLIGDLQIPADHPLLVHAPAGPVLRRRIG
jgi:hypothetical protein